MTPGFHTLPAAVYHADPCASPSLSASLAKVLLQESPRRAWFSHPKLNPDYREDHDAKFDIGTAAHSLLLEGDDVMRVIEADDWRTKAAKEQRTEARAMGKLPVLAHQAASVRAMVSATRKFLSDCEVTEYWNEANSEVTAIWQEGSVWLRSRLDRLAKNHRCIIDVKTTETAAPEVFHRQISRMGYDVQHAFHRRAVRSLTERDPAFVFLAISCEPPFECSLHGLDPAMIEIADAKVTRAIQEWRVCLQTSRWPSYGSRIHYAMPTSWQIQEHEMRLLEAA